MKKDEKKVNDPPWYDNKKFPEGNPVNKVLAESKRLWIKAMISAYPTESEDKQIISFPGTPSLKIALDIWEEWAPLNFNNVQCHTIGTGNDSGEDEFKVTTDCERYTMAWLADLCGGSKKSIDGYITSGGTEANIMGVWVGREFLRNKDKKKPIAAIMSYEAHYSIAKALNLTDIGEKRNRDGSGLHLIGVDETGAISLIELENKIRYLFSKKGIRLFFLTLSAGTCLSGGVDDIESIAGEYGLLFQLQQELGTPKFFVHVDAAFGGYVLPFLLNPIKFGFEFPFVESITIDPHKMGQMFYDCGVFLCRKGLLKKIKRPVGYVPGHGDMTLRGSRSAATAMALWAVTLHIGRNGYEKIIHSCREIAVYAQGRLREISGVTAIKSPMNFASFSVNQKITSDTKKWSDIEKRFTLRGEEIPLKYQTHNKGYSRVIKFPVMPHTVEKHVDALVDALKILSLK